MSDRLRRVSMTADAFAAVLAHSHSTEKEEIMGLLLGCFQKDEGSNGCTSVALISRVSVLRRLDRRKDRVEIADEQLAAAAIECDAISHEIGQKVNIVGWYHSHPHITIHPSHVDLSTQAMYQQMSSCFVGIICSCFNSDQSYNARLQITCFQSLHGNGCFRELPVPLFITPVDVLTPLAVKLLTQLPQTMLIEEREAFMKASNVLHSLSSHSSVSNQVAILHNSSVYTRSLCVLLEKICGPLLQTVELRCLNMTDRIESLLLEKKRLQAELILRKESEILTEGPGMVDDYCT